MQELVNSCSTLRQIYISILSILVLLFFFFLRGLGLSSFRPFPLHGTCPLACKSTPRTQFSSPHLLEHQPSFFLSLHNQVPWKSSYIEIYLQIFKYCARNASLVSHTRLQSFLHMPYTSDFSSKWPVTCYVAVRYLISGHILGFYDQCSLQLVCSHCICML